MFLEAILMRTQKSFYQLAFASFLYLLFSTLFCDCFTKTIIQEGPRSDIVSKAEDRLFVQTNDSTLFTLFPHAYTYTTGHQALLFGYPAGNNGQMDQPTGIPAKDIDSTFLETGGIDSRMTAFVLRSGTTVRFRPNRYVFVTPMDSSGLWGMGTVLSGKDEHAFAGRVPVDEKTVFWFREYNSTGTNILIGGVALAVIIKLLSDIDCIICISPGGSR